MTGASERAPHQRDRRLGRCSVSVQPLRPLADADPELVSDLCERAIGQLVMREVQRLAALFAWGPRARFTSEQEALLLRVVASWMRREVEQRRKIRQCEQMDPASEWPAVDGLPDKDREALAHAVSRKLQFADPHGEHGAAWSLCELAGWPS